MQKALCFSLWILHTDLQYTVYFLCLPKKPEFYWHISEPTYHWLVDPIVVFKTTQINGETENTTGTGQNLKYYMVVWNLFVLGGLATKTCFALGNSKNRARSLVQIFTFIHSQEREGGKAEVYPWFTVVSDLKSSHWGFLTNHTWLTMHFHIKKIFFIMVLISMFLPKINIYVLDYFVPAALASVAQTFNECLSSLISFQSFSILPSSLRFLTSLSYLA